MIQPCRLQLRARQAEPLRLRPLPAGPSQAKPAPTSRGQLPSRPEPRAPSMWSRESNNTNSRRSLACPCWLQVLRHSDSICVGKSRRRNHIDRGDAVRQRRRQCGCGISLRRHDRDADQQFIATAESDVKPRSSVFRYKGKETNPQTIGKELNVQAILNGRVVQRGTELSLFVELIHVSLDKVIWSQQYNRSVKLAILIPQNRGRKRCRAPSAENSNFR